MQLSCSGRRQTSRRVDYFCLQALGFHIWVAELELLVGQARGPKQSVDPVAAMELLQKLQVTIESSDKARIREYQRRCEDALESVLLKGTAPPVRATSHGQLMAGLINACPFAQGR